MKLVLLPGLDGTGVLFRPLLTALPPHIEPTVVSYPTQSALGYDELLPIVREALPKDEPYALLGESFGGPLSLRIAAERPKGLKALVLCGTFVSCPHGYVPGWAARCVYPWPFRAFPLLTRCKSWFMRSTAAQLALSLEAVCQVGPHVLARRIREVVRVNVERELRAVDVPMLYLQGAYDWTVPAANLRRIVRMRPDIKALKIECSHMILKNQPVVAAQAIADFIDPRGERRACIGTAISE
jgi:pimeloyl-[acyl-carrier protein] methyl ester esterase